MENLEPKADPNPSEGLVSKVIGEGGRYMGRDTYAVRDWNIQTSRQCEVFYFVIKVAVGSRKHERHDTQINIVTRGQFPVEIVVVAIAFIIISSYSQLDPSQFRSNGKVGLNVISNRRLNSKVGIVGDSSSQAETPHVLGDFTVDIQLVAS